MDNAVISDELTAVISDELTELLKNRRVKAAVFTTYNFEINFFESQVIPLLLNNDTAYSNDEWVKRGQVRVELQKARTQTPLPLEIFYDGKLFRKQGRESPRMEYLCHGVDLSDSAFHAKVGFILVHDEYWESDCLLVGAGSNNLSYPGWWENVECQHWGIVWPKDKNGYWDESSHPPDAFLKQLRNDMEYLKHLRCPIEPHSLQDDAIKKISDFLKECEGQEQYETFTYYGIKAEKNRSKKTNRFKVFLEESFKALSPYQSWNLEIISPFFAEDTENKEHRFFLDELGVKKILMLLPKNGEKALCKKEYYDHIKDEKEIYWAKWKPAIEKKLSAEKRRLHAKIYRFCNGKQSWAFVGSVNFTHKAMRSNVEAGFFTKLEKVGPLLERLEEEPAGFDVPKETAPGDEDEIPQIYLAYDWTKKKLCGQTGESEGVCIINIHLPEGGDRYAIKGWEINNKECHYKGKTEALKNLLKNTSLVKVSGRWQSDNRSFPEHLVLLQETGWLRKPLDMPPLSIQEIQSLYADMNLEGNMNLDRLMKAIEDAETRKQVLKGTAGESQETDDDPEIQQFFCDYANIFHAFGGLKERLRKELAEKNINQIDYYLTGNTPDSLLTLINQLAKMPKTSEDKEGDKSNKDDNGQDPVLSYLRLLCIREIYDEFSQGSFLAEEQLKTARKQLKKVKECINEYKSKIVLEKDNTSDRRERFLKWFEKQFYEDYKLAESKNEARTT